MLWHSLQLALRQQRLSDWPNEAYPGYSVAATQAVLRLLSSFRSLACAVRGMTSAGHRWSTVSSYHRVQGDQVSRGRPASKTDVSPILRYYHLVSKTDVSPKYDYHLTTASQPQKRTYRRSITIISSLPLKRTYRRFITIIPSLPHSVRPWLQCLCAVRFENCGYCK